MRSRGISGGWIVGFLGLTAVAAACAAPEGEEDGTSEAAATDGFAAPDEPAPTSYVNRGVANVSFVNLDRSCVKGEQAKKGLDDVLEGRGFRVAFPVVAAKAAERLGVVSELIGGIVGNRPDRIDTTNADGRFMLSGKLPSFAGRPVPSGTALGTSAFTRNGVELTNNNCFTCHAGMVRGQVVAGLGNHDIDQTVSLADLEKLLKIETALRADLRVRNPVGPQPELDELSDFFDNARGTIAPTYRFAESRGDNMGPYAVWKRLSRLKDPKTSGLQELPLGQRTQWDDLFDSVALTPVDPTPWWNRKYKKTSYAWGESSPAVAAHFAFNFTTPTAKVNELHEEHTQAIANILAFAEQSSSPAYPGKLDAAQVKLGAALFHGKKAIASGETLGCSNCHGSYTKSSAFDTVSGWTVDYPDRDVVDVGTDSAYSEIVKKLTPLATRGNGLADFFGARGKPEIAPHVTVPNKPGYVAPVLVGVWASAPYFHNGSVPTLYGVLNSSARPAVWTRPIDNAFAYSTVRVGIAYTEVKMSRQELAAKAAQLASRDVASKERAEFRAIYDTREDGRRATGHTFGDAMNDAERFAVIEFLKSLSGDEMPARR